MLTVVKFFNNPQWHNPNKLISRTLLKIATVNWAWRGDRPQHWELWLVKIVSETQHGEVGGMFIVDPIVKLNPDTDMAHLPPTLYDQEIKDDVLIITPHYPDPGHYWMLPKDHRRDMATKHKAYAVVVNHGGTIWW